MAVTSVAAFAAPKKIKFKPYGLEHQDNGKGGKGPLGKQWTTPCDTEARPGIGPAGAIVGGEKPKGPAAKIKRSVDIMPDNRQKVSVLNDLLGYK